MVENPTSYRISLIAVVLEDKSAEPSFGNIYYKSSYSAEFILTRNRSTISINRLLACGLGSTFQIDVLRLSYKSRLDKIAVVQKTGETKMASPPPRIVDPANVQAIFHKIMERKQMKANDIKNMKVAIVEVHGNGQYDCTECPYKWHSHFSWIRINLMDMWITYRWKMKCRHCLKMYQPTFSIEETEKMVEKAICRYRGERYVSPTSDFNDGYRRDPYKYRPPHMPQLCEKCGWGQVECWTIPGFASFIQ